jgi:hypothetical protein
MEHKPYFRPKRARMVHDGYESFLSELESMLNKIAARTCYVVNILTYDQFSFPRFDNRKMTAGIFALMPKPANNLIPYSLRNRLIYDETPCGSHH